jgi:glycosyltransferase involved in cell wall biosynthesis
VPEAASRLGSVSVIIPARDEAGAIGPLIEAVAKQAPPSLDLEILVIDDGSRDGTGDLARQRGARVLRQPAQGRGNPASARNRAASEARGDLLIFLDADCEPESGWLSAHLSAHERGERIVGGPLDLPDGLPLLARADYYGGWYHVHSRRPAGPVPNHPPGNLSVRREDFLRTSGFTESGPAAYAHEELEWQAQLQRAGQRIWFAPDAAVRHRNRSGLGNLLRRSYRWGYSSVELKAKTGAARWAWLYRHPGLLVAASPLLAPAQTAYIVACWLRARCLEPLALAPLLLLARVAYCAGMAVGTVRWLRRGGDAPGERPRWE